MFVIPWDRRYDEHLSALITLSGFCIQEEQGKIYLAVDFPVYEGSNGANFFSAEYWICNLWAFIYAPAGFPYIITV